VEFFLGLAFLHGDERFCGEAWRPVRPEGFVRPYLANSYVINYNQAWHQAGAVGRFFTVGAKYTFW